DLGFVSPGVPLIGLEYPGVALFQEEPGGPIGAIPERGGGGAATVSEDVPHPIFDRPRFLDPKAIARSAVGTADRLRPLLPDAAAVAAVEHVAALGRVSAG